MCSPTPPPIIPRRSGKKQAQSSLNRHQAAVSLRPGLDWGAETGASRVAGGGFFLGRLKKGRESLQVQLRSISFTFSIWQRGASRSAARGTRKELCLFLKSASSSSWLRMPLGGCTCCAVLCSAVLCCAVQCCAVLCCAVLCCAVLCCAVLYFAVLCYTASAWKDDNPDQSLCRTVIFHPNFPPMFPST